MPSFHIMSIQFNLEASKALKESASISLQNHRISSIHLCTRAIHNFKICRFNSNEKHANLSTSVDYSNKVQPYWPFLVWKFSISAIFSEFSIFHTARIQYSADTAQSTYLLLSLIHVALQAPKIVHIPENIFLKQNFRVKINFFVYCTFLGWNTSKI